MTNESRVLMVILNLEVGGLERIVVDLAAGLAAEGVEVGVVTLRHGGPLVEQMQAQNIEVTELGLDDGIRLRNVAELRRHIREFKPDVVHSHGEAALFYSTLAKFSGVRFRHVHTRHGYEDISPRGRLRNRLSYVGCDAVACVSSDLSEHCEANEGVSASKLYTIINGVDLAPYKQLQTIDYVPMAPVIGHVARLAEVKNQRLLLDAFALVRKRLRAAHLAIVGDGPMRSALETHAKALNLGDSVCFHGETDDVPKKLAACHFFCLSSDSEGTPVSVLEAMAAGRPVVATAVGGLANMISKDTGVLCEPGNAKKLADAMFKVYAAADTYHEYSAAARASAASAQDLTSMMSAYLSIYYPETAAKQSA